ncbi:hypothetical protein EDB81DRAFT_845542 [Dactylonectria macrodidyma]|uniref:FAD-binding PCMH-type domain-containing protein n=1 Tax=Dactylonectria macrodidyma TaxID=307937 RepID=A0A9P9IRT9_9HYPO|nr:hypothetical protein EDB81DRAFT_845542 [Dactylonectria macrodidyma]
MAQPYPPSFLDGLEGASRETVEADAPTLVSLLDEHPSLFIFTRSTPSFKEVRQTCNSTVVTRPLAIVRPRNEVEVSFVVSYCSGHSPRIPLVIRGGGHDMWGRSLVEDGVVVDLRALNHVGVASDQTFARIGGGITGGALIKQLETLDLATPTGFSLVLRKYGLGCDQILAARVVTATGKVVDTNTDPELLWALRGAGNGNFGAVIELTIKVYPCPSMLGGYLGYSLADATNVFAKFQELISEKFPDEFSGDFLCGYVPGLGHSILMLYTWVQDNGDLSKAKTHLEKFQTIGDVLLNTVDETTPYGFASSLDPVTAVILPYHFRTRTVKSITPDLVKIFQEIQGPIGPSHIISHNAHGAAIKPEPGSCFPNRRPHIVFGIGAAPPHPYGPGNPEMDAARTYSNNMAAAIKDRGLALESAYMNFSPPEECDAELFYGKEATERLRALKMKYDSQNIFFKGYPTLV